MRREDGLIVNPGHCFSPGRKMEGNCRECSFKSWARCQEKPEFETKERETIGLERVEEKVELPKKRKKGKKKK